MGIAESMEKALREIAAKNLASVEVGFLEDATYPDGTPVAAVAYWNEYGNGSAPPRPFFRHMIENEKETWGPKLAAAYKGTGGDGEAALAILGDNIQGALIQSINDFSEPALAQSTIKRKGFSKPLIDQAIMVNRTGFRVVK